MDKRLAGVIGPVVTPFDAESGDVAPVALRANIRAHLESGLSGVLVAGSTGEAVLLDERERELLVEWARDVVPADRWLLAGVGAESTRQCVARARAAAQRGADAVLVLAPHYYASAMTAEALSTHFRRVADESPVPVLLYNIPKYTGFALDAGLVHELATHGNIIGMKDSSGDLKLLGTYLGAQREGFTVLTGNGGTLYAALEMGSPGGILAVALFTGGLAPEIWSAFRDGDRMRAGAVQERLRPVSKEIVGTLGIAGVKAALDIVGLHGGAPRPPLLPLRAAQRQQIAAMLTAAGAARAA